LRLRTLAEDDLPAVARLHARVYRGHAWPAPEACAAYFRSVLFDGPWRDRELPSWVVEDGGGIRGLYAVLPRRMRFRGRWLRVAVGCQFMVDPERRGGLAALQLLKACLAGPQDLTFADGATEDAARLWLGLGGAAALLYSMHWVRPLRPARHAVSMARDRGMLAPPLAAVARPFAAAADACVARLRPNRDILATDGAEDAALDAATMCAHLPEMMERAALRPDYEPRELGWLLEQAAAMKRHGALRARLVRDQSGAPAGWYLYYVRTGAVAEVLQIAARAGSFDFVLRHLLADAWRQRATAVRGRLDPRYAQELSYRHCWLRRDGAATLVHARDPQIVAAIQRGDAFLSRLEGEWCLRFHGG